MTEITVTLIQIRCDGCGQIAKFEDVTLGYLDEEPIKHYHFGCEYHKYE